MESLPPSQAIRTFPCFPKGTIDHDVSTDFPGCSVTVFLTLAGPAPQARSADKVLFNRDIRPILTENCFQCHGPDKTAQGRPAPRSPRRSCQGDGLRPGQGRRERLVARIHSDDPAKMMPPRKANKKLTAEQKAILALGRRGGCLPGALVL